MNRTDRLLRPMTNNNRMAIILLLKQSAHLSARSYYQWMDGWIDEWLVGWMDSDNDNVIMIIINANVTLLSQTKMSL